MTVPEKGPGGGVIGFCTPVREILRPNQGIIPCRRRHLSAAGDPHTVPRARSGASRGKVCYRVLAASAVLVCTCNRRTLRVATSRCGCACAVQHRLQRRTRTAVRTGASPCDTRRWPHVLSCACIAAQSRAAMVRRLSVWTNRASVSPLIAIRSV